MAHASARQRTLGEFKRWYADMQDRCPTLATWMLRLRRGRLLNDAKKDVRGRRNRIIHDHALLNGVRFEIRGHDNHIEIQPGCELRDVIFKVWGDGHRVVIGRGVRFHHGGTIWIEDTDCQLDIGEGSSFENVHLALTEPGSRLTIGRDCMFAYDIDVRTGDSHSILLRDTGERINHAKDVSIGDHVWVAAHSIILKGVCIQANSVIATGSVVTRSPDEADCLMGGNPAKVIRRGITWCRPRLAALGATDPANQMPAQPPAIPWN